MFQLIRRLVSAWVGSTDIDAPQPGIQVEAQPRPEIQVEPQPEAQPEIKPKFLLQDTISEYERRKEELERRLREEPAALKAKSAGLDAQAEELDRQEGAPVRRELNRRNADQLRSESIGYCRQAEEVRRHCEGSLYRLEGTVQVWEAIKIAHEGQILLQTRVGEGTQSGLKYFKERRLVRWPDDGRVFVIQLYYRQVGKLLRSWPGGYGGGGGEEWMPTGEDFCPPMLSFITDSVAQFTNEELELLV